MNWKSGNGNKGPWGSGGGKGGGNNGGNGGQPRKPSGGNKRTQPDIDEVIRRSQERLKQMFPDGQGGGSAIYAILAVIALMLWMASGIYMVGAKERGVVLRFGEYHRTTGPGLQYHWPFPVERVLKPEVTSVNRIEVGFRSFGAGAEPRPVPRESLMLTGDENIVDINFEVQWKIRDAEKFLFNTRNPEGAVKTAAESAMREIIGFTPIARAMSEGRLEVETKARDLLQAILDSYDAGIDVVRLKMLKSDPPAEVIDAFRDVQTARADMERLINQAEAYSNDILPRARGEAAKQVLDAKAYREQVIKLAEGEASRFAAVYKEYEQSKDVIQKRIYLETMEEILTGMNKLVVDDALKGVVPLLPLNNLAPAAGR